MLKERIIQFIMISSLLTFWSIVLVHDHNETGLRVKQWDVFLNNSLPRIMYDGNLIKAVEMIHLQEEIPIFLADHEDNIILSNIDNEIGKNINSLSNNDSSLRTIQFNSKYLGSYFLKEPKLIDIHFQKYVLQGIASLLIILLLYSRMRSTADLMSVKDLLLYIRSDNHHIKKNTFRSSYIHDLILSVIDYKKRIHEYTQQLKVKTKKETAGEIARQVAHDIRSPLAALDMSMDKLSRIKETDRVIIRSAIHRIHDIANTLLEKNTPSEESTIHKKQTVLLTGLIERLITEKRLQYRYNKDLTILSNFDKKSYGFFSNIDPSEFKRVLSNIINNSVEAKIENSPIKIQVSIEKVEKNIIIQIKDDGKGIPIEILEKISNQSLSFGKSNGHGLGLKHAKEVISDLGGSIVIESPNQQGTLVNIIIPEGSPPSWFTPYIEVRENTQVLILDDDQSIHYVWDERLNCPEIQKANILIYHFYNTQEISHFLSSEDFNKDNFILLSDYEIIGDKLTGLDVIKKFNISYNSFLITSYYEDKKIQNECSNIGLKLIPKELAKNVPFKIYKPSDKKIVVHLDDDDLIRQVWKIKSKKIKDIDFYSYSNFSELKRDLSKFPSHTFFYIDQELSKEDPRGITIAKDLSENDFPNIYLSTGHEKEDFAKFPYLKDVVGKEFPNNLF